MGNRWKACFMKNRTQKILFTIVFIVSIVGRSQAQNAIVPTGGEASSNAGSVSYTIGQIAVQQSNDQDISISEGVQQPYEIQSVGVDNYPNIVLDAKVYPNPTSDRLILTIGSSVGANNYSPLPLRATLHNTNGQHIRTMDVTIPQTDIDMTALSAGTYYLRVTDGQTTLKTFKVVKTM